LTAGFGWGAKTAGTRNGGDEKSGNEKRRFPVVSRGNGYERTEEKT
jgi:hypothetical protein